MKNRFIRTLKLYIRSCMNPILLIFALTIIVGLPIALACSPSPRGDKEYPVMLGCAGMGHMGLLILQIFCMVTFSRSKFFISTADAKRLFTVIPVVVSTAMGIIYDAVVVIVGLIFIDLPTAADLMIVCSLSTVVCAFSVSANGKKGLEIISTLAFMLICCESITMKEATALRNGFGLTLAGAALVSAAVLIIGIGLTVLIMRLWWSKSDRIKRSLNTTVPMVIPEMFGGS